MSKNIELHHFVSKHSKTKLKHKNNTFVIINTITNSIVHVTNDLHESQHLNFYVPNENEKYYDAFKDFLFNKLDDLNNTSNYNLENSYDVMFKKNIDLNTLPFYHHTTFTCLNNLTMLPLEKNLKNYAEQNNTVFYNFKGPVPNLNIKIDDNVETRYLKKILEKMPILHKTHKLLQKEEFEKDTQSPYVFSRLSKYLPQLCYYTKKGPFSKCWIKFGYDLKLDKENFRYQRIERYKIGHNIKFLFEDSKLLKEIEKNKEKLLRKKFHLHHGWFRDEMLNFIKKYARNQSLKDLVQ